MEQHAFGATLEGGQLLNALILDVRLPKLHEACILKAARAAATREHSVVRARRRGAEVVYERLTAVDGRRLALASEELQQGSQPRV